MVNKKLLLLAFAVMMVVSVGASVLLPYYGRVTATVVVVPVEGVVRSFSSDEVVVGEDLVVTLHVNVSDADYYAIDEFVPVGWVVKDSGTASTNHIGHLKWVVIQDAVDTTYTYSLTAISGGETVVFGEYMFDGMQAVEEIGGKSIVMVLAE